MECLTLKLMAVFLVWAIILVILRYLWRTETRRNEYIKDSAGRPGDLFGGAYSRNFFPGAPDHIFNLTYERISPSCVEGSDTLNSQAQQELQREEIIGNRAKLLADISLGFICAVMFFISVYSFFYCSSKKVERLLVYFMLFVAHVGYANYMITNTMKPIAVVLEDIFLYAFKFMLGQR